jgi:hypothetical protein
LRADLAALGYARSDNPLVLLACGIKFHGGCPSPFTRRVRWRPGGRAAPGQLSVSMGSAYGATQRRLRARDWCS